MVAFRKSMITQKSYCINWKWLFYYIQWEKPKEPRRLFTAEQAQLFIIYQDNLFQMSFLSVGDVTQQLYICVVDALVFQLPDYLQMR